MSQNEYDDEYGYDQSDQQPPDLPPNGGGDWGYEPVPNDGPIDLSNSGGDGGDYAPQPKDDSPKSNDQGGYDITHSNILGPTTDNGSDGQPTGNNDPSDAPPLHPPVPPPPGSSNGGNNNKPTDPWADIEAQLKKMGGSMYDPSDLEGIKRNSSYSGNSTNKAQSIDQLLKNAMDNYKERETNTPGVDKSGAHTGVSWWPTSTPAPTGTPGTPGQPTGLKPSAGPSTPTGTKPGGNTTNGGMSIQDILAALGGLGGQIGGPGTSGVYPNDVVQQVGQDPLSQIITGGYGDFLGRYGMTPLGEDMDATLRGLISRGGQIDEDPSIKAQKFEAARQPIESMRKAQTNEMRGQLASRGLISEPGQPQGSEISSLGRIDEHLAPYYATAGQKLAGDQSDADNARLSQALTLATGLSQQQAQNFLSGLNSATDRQKVLSDIALGALDRNIVWNQFLAELGLDRAKFLYAAQNQGIDSLMPLLQMFSQYVGMANGGYI